MLYTLMYIYICVYTYIYTCVHIYVLRVYMTSYKETFLCTVCPRLQSLGCRFKGGGGNLS